MTECVLLRCYNQFITWEVMSSSEKALVKKLNAMNQEEFVKIISDLFKTNKFMEARLNLMILDDEYGSELLGKYKKQLYKIFNPSNIVRTGFSLERAQMILSDFANICGSGRWYDALGEAYHDAVAAASEDEELYKLWKDRLEYIYHEFYGFGWGMDDYITGEYYSIPWLEED